MKHLLIVEDDSDIQDYYQILFSGQPIEIHRAYTGKEGIGAIDGGAPFDLVILDIVLPEMGGEEFFRILRQERKSTVRVIVSSVDEKLVKPLLEHGTVDGVFLKGEPGSALVRMVRAQLGLA